MATVAERSLAAAGRVALGAALLDKNRPGWAGEIHVSRLNMASPKNDILGQLYGYFFRGLEALGLTDAEAVTLGFNGERAGDYRLRAAWVAEIRKRLRPQA
jgi:hypothetical protein